MDRLMLKRGLLTLGGLALLIAGFGCRHHNTRVPPPHDAGGQGAPAPSYPGGAPSSTGATAMDPYANSAYGPTTSDSAQSGAYGGYNPTAGAAAAGTSTSPGADYGTVTPSASSNAYNNGSYPGSRASDPYAGAADPYAGTADPYAGTADPYAGTTSADPYAGAAYAGLVDLQLERRFDLPSAAKTASITQGISASWARSSEFRPTTSMSHW